MTEIEQKSSPPKKAINKRKITAIVCAVVTVVAIAVILALRYAAVKIESDSIRSSYRENYKSSYDEALNRSYQYWYDKNFEKYKVSNRVSITVDSIRTEEKLEVLKVSDVEYVIRSEGEGESRYDVWLEVSGIGTYTVNLRASEFITDNEHSYVLVRIPEPVLTDFDIDREHVQVLQFSGGILTGILNGSYIKGVGMAQADVNKGYNMVKESLTNNPDYKNQAKESACEIIKRLVRSLNSQVEDLRVDVKFYG